jgi:ectoine hydroxylase-related dioxygenase (phytanoyl-CoA dioxygenase family)
MIFYSNKKNMLNHFENKGFFVIKNFFSKKEISYAKKEIFQYSKIFFNKRIKYSENNFDYYIKNTLNKKNNFSSKFYDLSKKFISMNNMVFNKKIIDLGRKILKTENIGILNRAYGYRMDRPKNKKFLTQLHQDYVQNLGAPEGIVFYSSLRNVDQKSGPVVIYQGSHKLGLLNIKLNKKEKNYSRSLILNVNKSSLNKNYKKIYLKIKSRDLAVFDFLLLHESSPNKSNDIRWSLISRFFSFNSTIGKKNMFCGGNQEGNRFENIHPEKMIW